MTAQLIDHHGAIDPAAFDADHPIRPHAPKSATKDLASNRLWGNVTRRSSSRRIVAVGWPTGKRPGTTYVLHAPIGHGMISRVQVL